MKNRAKKLIATVCLLFMIPGFIIPASANSRAQEWHGSDANGVIFKEGNVPIEVESELLTLDIPTLPYASYRSGEYFLKYDSKVTAEYTFYNPTDMTVTATLVFPFGARPEYSNLIDKDGNSLYQAELNKYDVTVNGKSIEKTVRHTYGYSPDGRFNTDYHIAKLSDEYLTDEFYHPNLSVTKYTFQVDGIDKKFLRSSSMEKHVGIQIKYNGYDSERKIFENDIINVSNNKDECLVSGTIEENGTSFSIYVFGNPLPYTPEINLYYYTDYGRGKEKIDGTVTRTAESMTFEEFAFSNYDESRGVSKVDWYNALITEMTDDTPSLYGWFNGYINLMRWYEYEITLAPGEKIVNTVTAPIYPRIEAWNQPYKYHYTYLLSPASNWASFGKLDIVINTSYEMSESSVAGFEKTEDGYKLSREGLPMDEEGCIDLVFTLLNDGNTPKNQPNPNKAMGVIENVFNFIGSLFVLAFVAITQIIGSIFYSFK